MLSQLWIRLETARNGRIITILSLIMVWVSLVLLLMSSPVLAQEMTQVQSLNPQALLQNALAWVDSLGSVGAIAFIGIYMVATVAFVPGSILTLGAGVVFGIVFGSLFLLMLSLSRLELTAQFRSRNPVKRRRLR